MLRLGLCRHARSSTLNKPLRNLNLHEYQSVQLMRKFKVDTPKGDVASSAAEAEEIGRNLPGGAAVKAQVLAGGRGLGHFDNGYKSGVHLVDTPGEAKECAANMIGANLITKQTDAAGRPCAKVLVVEKVAAVTEKYFAIMMDRETLGPMVVASAMGGVTIEDIAEKNPEVIIKQSVPINQGMTPALAASIAERMQFTNPSSTAAAAANVERLYELFIGSDATMVEVNPFSETEDGRVIAVDAKLNFDDNAAFRQQEIFEQRDFTQEDSREVAAAKHDLNYIGLDGSIGCMVNGAGLAMATMDIVKLHGGTPANFLDVGGGANENQVTEAFRILTSDPNVKCILVNIFGGIMRCDTIAQGIIKAAETLKLSVPVVVRLAGTNVDQANELIEKSGLNLIRASDLDDAAVKAVDATK